MQIIEQHIVKLSCDKERIYDYLPGKLETITTRKGIKKALRQGRILLNSKKAKSGDYINSTDVISLLEREVVPFKVFPAAIEIIYEDEYLAVVNKPAGLLTSGNAYKTLHNTLPHNLKKSSKQDALPWPLPIHRLDKPTSGLVIIAKTYESRVLLGRMMEEHQIHKTYFALVQGQIKCSGILNSPIDEKKAVTYFNTEAIFPCTKNGFLSLLKLRPKTGRKHQLRIHLARLGYPILGDTEHGNPENTLLHKGLFLVAKELNFLHPISKKELSLELPLPKKFVRRMKI